MGQAPRGDSYNLDRAGLPLIAGAGDFKKGVIAATKFTSQPSKVSAAGDIILSIRASIGARVWSDGEYCLGRGVAGLRPNSRLDRDYLWHWLGDSEQALASKGRGATFLQVNKADIGELQMELPPIEEQRRIAAILDQADAVRAKRRQVLAHLDDLTQSIFHDMFGDNDWRSVTPRNLPPDPHGWEWVLLTDLAQLATGHTPDRSRDDYWNGDIPWISLPEIRNLDGKTVFDTEIHVAEHGISNSSAVVLPVGTVCYSRTASIGFVTTMGRPMATSQDFHNWVPGPLLDSAFLMTALRLSRAHLIGSSDGSTHKTMYQRVAERLRVLLPPVALQHRFASCVDTLNAQRAAVQRAQASDDELFASLQSRAFKGEL